MNHLSCRNENEFLRLWVHECQRVFQDRLIDQTDQTTLFSMLKLLVKENFNKDWVQLSKTEELMFSHIIPVIYPNGDTNMKPIENVYCELVPF